jgi:hypothetical protein
MQRISENRAAPKRANRKTRFKISPTLANGKENETEEIEEEEEQAE